MRPARTTGKPARLAGVTDGRAIAEGIVRSGIGPREILERLATGDPLGLEESGARRIRERFHLIDPDRLFQRSLLRVALAAPGPGREEETFEHWLTDRIDEAIGEALRQDQERLIAGDPPPRPEHHDFMDEWMGIEPEAALAAAVRFNGLPRKARRVFFELIVEGKSVARCLEDGLGPAEMLRVNARRALSALLGVTFEGEEKPSVTLEGDR